MPAVTRAPRSLTRAGLLRRGAAAGAAAALGGGLAGRAVAQGGRNDRTGNRRPGGVAEPTAFFRSPVLNGEMLFALGASSYGAAEIGEVLEAVRAINARTGDPERPRTRDFDVYVRTFAALGARLTRQAREARDRGDLVTARGRFLRSSAYYAQALFFVLGTSQPGREENVFRATQRAWLAAIDLFDPPAVRLSIRADDLTLPAYLFRPDASGRPRATVIICNGSDGQNVDLVAQGLAAGLERGCNVLLFEGPGQMSLLFEQQIPFRPDWSRIVGPVVQTLAARPDVDASRIAAVGISFLGMVLASAAARTPGLAAIVLEPGAVDYPRLWGDKESMRVVLEVADAPERVREGARRELNAGFLRAWRGGEIDDVDRFTISKRGEIFSRQALRDARAGRPPSDYFGLLSAMLPFDYAADLRRITVPTLVTANQSDQFFADQSPQAFRLLRSLPPERKQAVRLTTAEGAGLHDQPIGAQVGQEHVYDWLARTLGT
jgi:dienelactone hydrolase